MTAMFCWIFGCFCVLRRLCLRFGGFYFILWNMSQLTKTKKKVSKKSNPVGAPVKYTVEVCKDMAQQLVSFFDVEATKIIHEKFYYKNGDEKKKEIEVANELPTLIGFCRKYGVNKETLIRLVKMRDENGGLIHKELTNAYKKIKAIQKDIWMKNSLKGLYNAQFAIFTGKNVFGWKDKHEIEHKVTNKFNGLLGGVLPEDEIIEGEIVDDEPVLLE